MSNYKLSDPPRAPSTSPFPTPTVCHTAWQHKEASPTGSISAEITSSSSESFPTAQTTAIGTLF